MVIDADTRRIICVHFAPGAHHDFSLYKKSALRLHPGIHQKADLGYLGVNKLAPNTALPHKNTKKHKLTKEQKSQNRAHSKVRIRIEHTNGKAKVFKLLENRYRAHSRYELRVTLIASFINANNA